MTHHGVAHRLADDETDPGGLGARGPRPHVKHQGWTCDTTAATDGSGEVRAPSHTVNGGQHRLRQRGGRGPYGGARTGSTDRRASASGGENRGSWPDDGCWAGTYASTRGAPVMTGRARRGRPPLGGGYGEEVWPWNNCDARSVGNGLRYNGRPPAGQTGPDLRHHSATFQRVRDRWRGGADTPGRPRYGVARCGQPLDVASPDR